jgi:hypothetical protein
MEHNASCQAVSHRSKFLDLLAKYLSNKTPHCMPFFETTLLHPFTSSYIQQVSSTLYHEFLAMAETAMPYLDPHNMTLLQSLGTISNGKPFSEFTIPQQRELFREVQSPQPADQTADRQGITKSQYSIDTSHGAVKTFFYAPGENPNAPLVYYVHGGGWIFGGAAEFEAFLYDLVDKTGVGVVFPEYTLAPEKQFPVQHEQCLQVLQHVLKVGKEEGLTVDRVVLAGDSSGGKLFTTSHSITTDLLQVKSLRPCRSSTSNDRSSCPSSTKCYYTRTSTSQQKLTAGCCETLFGLNNRFQPTSRPSKIDHVSSVRLGA